MMHARGMAQVRKQAFERPAWYHLIQCAVVEDGGVQVLGRGVARTYRALDGAAVDGWEFGSREEWASRFLTTDWLLDGSTYIRGVRGKGCAAVIAPEWDSGPGAHTGVLEALAERGYRLQGGAALEGRLPFYGRHLRKGHRTLTVTDFHNLLPVSLRVCAEQLGVERPYGARIEHGPGWREACLADIAVMRRMLVSFLERPGSHGLAGLPRSLSGTAAAIAHLPGYIAPTNERMVYTPEPAILRGQREYCQGGLIIGPEPQEKGEPVYGYDQHSAYPAVACSEWLPVDGRQWSEVRRIPAEELLGWMKERPGWHYAHVDLVGGDRRHLCGSFDDRGRPIGELALYAGQGLIAGVREVRTMTRLGRPYKRFLEAYYALRMEAQGLDRWVVKLLLNSLLGRTAGRGGQWERATEEQEAEIRARLEAIEADGSDEPVEIRVDGERAAVRDMGSHYEYLGAERAEGYYSQPAYWAALVSAQRARLEATAALVRSQGGRVFYGDTDSLYLDAAGAEVMEGLDVGDGMGQWEADPRGPDKEAQFRRPRNYRFHGEEIRAGIRLDGAAPVALGYLAQYGRNGHTADRIYLRGHQNTP